MQITVVVPTYNESSNIAELVRRLQEALTAHTPEVIFVDDSTDDTPTVVRQVSETASIPVRLIHRIQPVGGLGGAVIEGIRAASSDVCIVMDGDLQHPPETILSLLQKQASAHADVVVASRYVGNGSAGGLADVSRVIVSRASTLLTKAMFPVRLREVSDPMTGFFLVDRRSINLETLHPRGFKILLEILARTPLRVSEVPFRFEERFSGDSKASLRQGFHFLRQLTALRFGKMSLFAFIGAVGAVANLAIMWMLMQVGVGYVAAAVIAAETTIIGNFIAQDRLVFKDMAEEAGSVWLRLSKSFTFNNIEALVRIPVLALLVSTWHFQSMFAAALTLGAAFIARFAFHSLVVYAPRSRKQRAAQARAREERPLPATS
ncbi:glycosyltransferase [Microbacterium sp.]|uniref:glycosyltransferase n=1 Tax=Microbacterium sp. TaxID=51671 RepID=UPI003A8F3BB7